MYGVAALLVLAAMALALVRALRGPTVFDRILAVNVFGTATVIMISLVGFMMRQGALVDIALIYALISFTGTIAVLRFTEYRREIGEREAREAGTRGADAEGGSPGQGAGGGG